MLQRALKADDDGKYLINVSVLCPRYTTSFIPTLRWRGKDHRQLSEHATTVSAHHRPVTIKKNKTELPRPRVSVGADHQRSVVVHSNTSVLRYSAVNMNVAISAPMRQASPPTAAQGTMSDWNRCTRPCFKKASLCR